MSVGAFRQCLAFIWLPENDGQSIHNTPGDTGGWTNMGITLTNWRNFKANQSLTAVDLAAATDFDLSAFYRVEFWNHMQLEQTPAGMDMMLLNAACLSGAPRAAMLLQEQLGVTIDGYIGEETLDALRKVVCIRPVSDQLVLYVDKHVSFLRELRTYAQFGCGWAARISRCLVVSRQMAKPSTPIS